MARGAAKAGGSLKRRSPGVQARASDNVETVEVINVMNNATAIPKENNVQGQTAQIIPFRQKELLLVESGGEPFVPMKPVVEGIGLTWASQTVKLNSAKARWGVSIIETPSAGGVQSYLCIPLRKLVGWLNSIQPNKVRPELREGIIAYQSECDDVLWAYWNDGQATKLHGRDVMTVLDELIGITEVNVIKGLIRDKAKVVSIDKRRSFQHTMHARLRTRFNVPRVELIPAQQFEAACNFVAAYALEGEWLPKSAGKSSAVPRPILKGQRWMVFVDDDGVERATEIPSDASVLSFDQFLKSMLIDCDMPVSTDEMFRFVSLAMNNLQRRSQVCNAQLRASRASR